MTELEQQDLSKIDGQERPKWLLDSSNESRAGGDGEHQLQIARKSLENVDWSNKRILDIGSSNGYITSEILKITGAREITGVELDPERLEKAKKLKEKNNESRLNFCLADARDLSMFEDNSFDGIFSNMAFQQLKDDLPRGLKEVYRLLKPGSQAIINFNQRKSDVTVELQKLLLKKDVTSKKKIDLDYFRKLAEEAGFSKVNCKAENDIFYFQDVDKLIGKPSKESFPVRNIQLSDQEVDDVWGKLRAIFLKKKTPKGFEETWDIVYADLTK